MKTIETSQQSGDDGKLRLEIPVESPGHNYHVVVVLEELREDGGADETWPPGYMDLVIGKWQGEFVIEPEGPFEQRESL